jgi:hypothetical protein
VALDGALRNAELLGDLAIREAMGH